LFPEYVSDNFIKAFFIINNKQNKSIINKIMEQVNSFNYLGNMISYEKIGY